MAPGTVSKQKVSAAALETGVWRFFGVCSEYGIAQGIGGVRGPERAAQTRRFAPGPER
jgi:hypothetical protein